ncbi:MAG TPA: TonB-dependent receptor [Gemmatimonadales bacterium]|nr:TonB-dependent receptor [Gemmatimonadales bacterium]
MSLRIPWLLLVWAPLPVGLAAQHPDTVRLAPVVVTATRIPTPAAAVAAAVTVVTGEELRARGLRTVAEALRTVPGVAVAEIGSFGGQTSLFLRGGESDYVKVLLDGVPLNHPGGALDLADLTLDNVDRIEIVRGPASVLYGSDAVTGVIQVFSRAGTPGSGFSLEAAARGGTYATSDLAVGVRGRGRWIGYAASASRFASDGLYRYNNDYRHTVVSGRVAVTPSAHTTADLAYRFGDDVYRFPTDGAGRPADSNQVSKERGPAVSLTLARTLSRSVTAQFGATLREQRIRFQDDPDSPGEDGRFESRDLVRRAGAGALVTWRVAERAAVTAGLEYEDQRQRGRSVFEASFGSFPDSIAVARWNRAAYVQALLGLDRPLTATVGVRLDHNSQFGGHATWRGGLVYRPGPATRLRAAFGSGFKEPTFFENFARGFVRGNPELDPERSLSWEAGLEHRAGAVTLAATYFRQRFRDLIEFTFAPAPPDSVNYFNVAGATAAGLETSLDVVLAGRWAGELRYTYLDTRVLEPGLDPTPDAAFSPGRPLLRRPAHTLTAGLRAPVTERALVAVEARFVGERDDLDFTRPAGERRVALDAYVRLNLAAQYDLVRSPLGPIVLTLRAENLLDDRSPEIAGFLPRGRTLLAGARLGDR